MENVRTGASKSDEYLNELEWTTSSYVPETIIERGRRKVKENPFVPIGVFMTLFSLGNGLKYFLRGDSKNSQIMMRWRVGSQAATIAVIVLGIIYHNQKQVNA